MERSHDLLEGGANIPVTSENKESYLELYAQFLLVGAVSRQMDHFKQGFLRVMSGAASISLFRCMVTDFGIVRDIFCLCSSGVGPPWLVR